MYCFFIHLCTVYDMNKPDVHLKPQSLNGLIFFNISSIKHSVHMCTHTCIYPVSPRHTYKCFLPTCASWSHVGLKEKAVVLTPRHEEAAAPAETPEPEPTPEGTTHVHYIHTLPLQCHHRNTLIVDNERRNAGVIWQICIVSMGSLVSGVCYQ